MLTFLEKSLRQDLEKLTFTSRAVFAASCAQRVVAWCGNAMPDEEKVRKLEEILQKIWEQLGGFERLRLAEELGLCDTMAAVVPEGSVLQDAIATVAYAIQSGDVDGVSSAVHAARTVYSLIDDAVITKLRIDMNAKGAESEVLSHPWVQRELARQKADMQDLMFAGSVSKKDLIFHIKARANKEGVVLLVDK